MYVAVKWRKPAGVAFASAICLFLVVSQLSTLSWSALQDAIRSIAAWQWAVAGAATWCSFLAVGGYDVIWHHQLKTGVTPRKARRVGMSAVAIAQTVGFGGITGTLVRWHMLRGQPIATAAMLTAAICVSFLAGWALIVTFAAGVLAAAPVSMAALATLAMIGILYAAPRILGHGAYLHLAPRIFALTVLDLFFAAVALWVLLPEPALTDLPLIVCAFSIALGAGLISNAPGGLGAFELVLLALVATVPDTALVAAILAFRVVYYLIPALCGALYFAACHHRNRTIETTDAPQSDLCHQGATLRQVNGHTHVSRRHLLGTVFLEPKTWQFTNNRTYLGFQALYKCQGRTAMAARQQGWTVRRIASDAIIDPHNWSIDGSARSSLRRKLKQAKKAGITVTRATDTLPIADMTAVANAWADHHGGELGYAMGRYSPDYVAHQRCYLIYHQDRLCGFMTVQARGETWILDLIRHLPGLPSGAMHAAVTQIIQHASLAGVTALSLGAVPDGPQDNALQRHCAAKKAGLRQFKSAFGPHWEPRYHIAPNPVQWALSLALIILHIQRPWARIPHLVRQLINIRKIIHLLHIKRYVRSGQPQATDKAQLHDERTFEITGRA